MCIFLNFCTYFIHFFIQYFFFLYVLWTAIFKIGVCSGFPPPININVYFLNNMVCYLHPWIFFNVLLRNVNYCDCCIFFKWISFGIYLRLQHTISKHFSFTFCTYISSVCISFIIYTKAFPRNKYIFLKQSVNIFNYT